MCNSNHGRDPVIAFFRIMLIPFLLFSFGLFLWEITRNHHDPNRPHKAHIQTSQPAHNTTPHRKYSQ